MRSSTASSLFTLAVTLTATPAVAQTTNQPVEEGAGVIAWIVVGLIGGYLASRMVNKTGEGMVRDILLGVIGGIVGGIIFHLFGGRGVTGSICGAFWSRLSARWWCWSSITPLPSKAAALPCD